MQPRKKILYVITKSNWGGAQRYVYDLACNLPRDQFEIAVACGGQGLLVEKLRQAGVRAISIASLERNVNLAKELLSLWFLFKVFVREKPDVIHLNSSKAGGLGAVAAFASKLLAFNFKPIRRTQGRLLTVFTVHGWAFDEDRPQWQKSAIKFASWFAALFQDKIVVINSADLAAAKKLIPERKLILIRNGIETKEILPREEARTALAKKAKVTVEPDSLVLGTIAELTPNKGLEHLIAAIPALKQELSDRRLKVIIIGDGEGRAKLEKMAGALAASGNVVFAGFVDEAWRFLNAFDIFTMPSLKEGLPYTLMEAMAAERPIVASRVGGIPDLVEHGRSGLLVKSKSASELAYAIARLARDTELSRRLASQARQKIQNEFSVDKMARQTAALYKGNTLERQY